MANRILTGWEIAGGYRMFERMRFPTVGAVYDRPQSVGLHPWKLRAVIDRPYSGEAHSFGAKAARNFSISNFASSSLSLNPVLLHVVAK
jgi:hypothetical protein